MDGLIYAVIPEVISLHGTLTSCPVCTTRSGRAPEAIRRFRAATTADNHILAQDMIQAATRPEAQKLLMFTDNRQDAAFQAGWMSDRARRYRLRHLMLQFLREAGKPMSVGDMAEAFMRLFAQEKSLARALCPEVYEQDSDEAFSTRLNEELKSYVRIQVLQEWTPGLRNRTGLEVLGLVKAVYAGLPQADDPWLRDWSKEIGCTSPELLDGIQAWLDTLRRQRLFWDEPMPVFSKRYFGTSDPIVARGYFPATDAAPKGLVVLRTEEPRGAQVQAMWAARGLTNLMHQARGWGVPSNRMEEFCRQLWAQATQRWMHDGRPILCEAPLVGERGGRLPGTVGARQMDSRLVGLVLAQGRWACSICQRVHTRPTPRKACTRHHCKGILEPRPVPAGHYDLANLQDEFTMILPREHSAQVPAADRQEIEDEFRKVGGEVNCLVATPTLELGVDIGGLDMVLLRNVPPTPANYWQRVGRAGRQERMAVLYTYCRTAQHDRYFYEDPMRLLAGRVMPPRFNLRNPVMVRKHVHAAVLSEFLRAMRLADPWSLGVEARTKLQVEWQAWFPPFLRGWLLDEDQHYRDAVVDLSGFRALMEAHSGRLTDALKSIFQPAWPHDDAAEVEAEILARYVAEMPQQLQQVAERLFRRFQWARQRMTELNREKESGKMPREREYQLRRCESAIRSMLSSEDRGNYLLSVLATEGFLPGYNEMEAGVTAYAGRHRQAGRVIEEFPLGRAASMAVREFVPGNRIYANRGQFRLDVYRFPAETEALEPVECIVDPDPDRPSVRERSAAPGGYANDKAVDLLVLPIADCQLDYASRIHDQELDRFRLPVTVLGYLREMHRGGDNLGLADLQIKHLRGQAVKLVNVGPNEKFREGHIGYRVCGACGGVRSPFDTDEALRKFEEYHKPHWPRIATPVGLGADVEVDGFQIRSPQWPDLSPLASLAEAIRRGAARVLEMNEEDLQILPLPTPESMELFLYDPMPGGSGLLDQIRKRWSEVRAAAIALCEECPGACERSCYECLRGYRNSFLHEQLDRKIAQTILLQAEAFVTLNAIPPSRGSGGGSSSSNSLEKRVREWLVGAGLPTPREQEDVVFEPPIAYGSETIRRTRPDLLYRKDDHGANIAIYADGPHHEKAEQRVKDRLMRDELQDHGWMVVVVRATEVGDETFMRRQVARIVARLSKPFSA